MISLFTKNFIKNENFVDLWKILWNNHHHHQVMQLAWISLTLFHELSLSSITPGRSSSLHPVSIQSYCWYVLFGCPTLACPCERLHRRTSLMILFLLLQHCPTCLVCLIWMVLEMVVGGRTTVVLWDVASRICSLQFVTFLCNSHQAFSLWTLSVSPWCIHKVELI